MILVTGGAGFIGSNLVAGLEKAGIGPIVICDRLGCGEKWRNVAKRGIEDIVPPSELFDWLEDGDRPISCIFHLGATSATTAKDADVVLANNFRFSQRLWRWCGRHRARFIYASSAAVYGDGESGFDDDVSEEVLSQLRPLNLYGWSKLLFDRWVTREHASGRGEQPHAAGLRFFNVYGPNEYHKGGQQSVVPQFHQQIIETGRVRMFRSVRPGVADGEQQRDFVHVDDCVDVMLWLFRQPSVTGIYNVGTGQARTFRDVATAVFRAHGAEPRVDFVDLPETVRLQYQHFTQARMDRLRAAGYDESYISIEDGVTRYIEDYLTATDPYR